MEQSNQPIAENEHVKEFLAVLQANPIPGSQEFLEMIGHVGALEQRLAEAVDELKTMRQELQKVQSHSLKAVLQRSYKSLESNAVAMGRRLSELKSHIADDCKNALASIREHGVAALHGIAQFFRVKPILEGMRKLADSSIRVDEKAMDKIQSFATEYHAAGKHLKNMGRTLVGKPPLEEAKNPGRIAKTLAAPYRADRACMVSAKIIIDRAVASLSRMEQSVQHRQSVLQTMRENSAKVQPPAQKAVPAVDKAER